MPPRLYSRYTFSDGIIDDAGALILTEPEPFGFVDLDDNIQHVVTGGDTLFNIAALYFRGLPRPSGLWWIITDFQPTPIIDPTLAIAAGTRLWVPSLRTVTERIFDESRRASTEG